LQHYLQARTKLGEVKGYNSSQNADFNNVALRLAQMTVDKPEKLDETLQHYLQARTKLGEVKGYNSSRNADFNSISLRLILGIRKTIYTALENYIIIQNITKKI
jgi:hypothetical protein